MEDGIVNPVVMTHARVGEIGDPTPLILLRFGYKRYVRARQPDEVQEEFVTFFLTRHQYVTLLQDLTRPLTDLLPEEEDE